MVQNKIAQLRTLMVREGMDAYIILSADAHQSEYVAPYWRARAYMSGFTGSAGTLIVTQEAAGLWTDGRYFIQAEQQLEGSGIQLFRMGEPGIPTWLAWTMENIPENACVGMDGRTLSVDQARTMQEEFDKKSITLACRKDLVGEVWEDRPGLPEGQIFDFPIEYAGQCWSEKVEQLRCHMENIGVQYYLVATLENSAWLLNYRGDDIEGTPVAYAYTLVTPDEVLLFVEPEKVEPVLIRTMEENGIRILSYHTVAEVLPTLTPGAIAYDPAALSLLLQEVIPAEWKHIEEKEIIHIWKAVKNPVERQHIREAHIKDGAVMVQFIKWIKEAVQTQTLREDEAAAWLDDLRCAQQNSLGISFDTIAGYEANGAIIHYAAESGKGAPLAAKGFLLVDSGGQYLEGTTDITRTIALGELTPEQKRIYTLVLKGHIALSRAVFKEGTTGPGLDILARKSLWEQGLDYKHGTGHGVGFVLGVHEGPMTIRQGVNTVALEPGMLVSNEPGYYEAGVFGVRIENLVMVRDREETPWGKFLEMETLTLCPYEREAIDKTLLDAEECKWLNAYHKHVYEAVAPRLDAETAEWLRGVTVEI